jgi:hypothetical protein
MSKLYAGFLVLASLLALSALGTLGLVLITHVINLAVRSSGMGHWAMREVVIVALAGALIAIIVVALLVHFLP